MASDMNSFSPSNEIFIVSLPDVVHVCIYVSLDNTHTYSTYTRTATKFLAFSHLYCLITSILHYFKSSVFVIWKFLLINEVQFLWTFFEILFFNVFYYEIKFTYMRNSAEMWSYIVTCNVSNTFCNM